MVTVTSKEISDRDLDALIAERVMGIQGPFGWSGPPRDNDTFWSHINSVLYATEEEATSRYKEYVVAKHGSLCGKIDEGHEASFCYWKDEWGPLVVDDYSTDIASAMQVVEKMQEQGWVVTLNSLGSKWETSFIKWNGSNAQYFKVDADSLPKAIVLAALEATKNSE